MEHGAWSMEHGAWSMEHGVEILKLSFGRPPFGRVPSFEIKKPQSQISDCEIFEFLFVSIYNLKSRMTR